MTEVTQGWEFHNLYSSRNVVNPYRTNVENRVSS